MGRKQRKLNKSQRMQLKAFICVLGLILLLLLLLGRILFGLLHREKGLEEKHIPVIEELANVWIMEADEEKIMIFHDGSEETYFYGTLTYNGNGEDSGNGLTPEMIREQIADVELTDGRVTNISVMTEKINGKILSADETGVEVEGYGRLPLAADYKGYRIYKALTMCTISDLVFGYNFADLVMDNGEICGLLLVREEAMDSIRVLIKTSDYAGLYHEQLHITADTAFTVQYGVYDNLITEQHSAGEELIIEAGSPYFTGDRITITPDVLTGKVTLKNINRSQGTPSYRGHIEIEKTEEGLVVVNEVLLEEYLYCVVPSEMPASYPEEALKAQAVCARTYAYGHMQKAGYPQYGAHVDDSTSYQVYNNILEQESTTTAVKESYGQLLFTAEGELAGTYYYSTSCGVGTDADIWKTQEAPTLTYLKAKAITSGAVGNGSGAGQEQTGENGGDSDGAAAYAALGDSLQDEEAFTAFIRTKNVEDFEVAEGWYRWTYQVKKLDAEHMCDTLQKRYDANEKLVLTLENWEYVSKPVKVFTRVTDLYIEKRGKGGVCDELIIETDSGTYKVISEHNIRYVLNDGDSKVHRQDGKAVDSPNLLPSGFFVLSVSREKNDVVGYTLTGGGFGHGVGMSQNGAKNMADYGLTSDDILSFFFDGCTVETMNTIFN